MAVVCNGAVLAVLGRLVSHFRRTCFDCPQEDLRVESADRVLAPDWNDPVDAVGVFALGDFVGHRPIVKFDNDGPVVATDPVWQVQTVNGRKVDEDFACPNFPVILQFE